MSSRGDTRRQSIFDRYVNNLNLLIDIVVIEAERDKYICPLCLARHSSIYTDGNSLTLEDAPPKSLGGKPRTLTCQSCNNTLRGEIDFWLMKKLDTGIYTRTYSTFIPLLIRPIENVL